MNTIYKDFGIDQETLDFVKNIEAKVRPLFERIDEEAEANQYKVIKAMQNVGLAERHFLPATGYGYSDIGREALENIFSEVFGAEMVLARPHISSGTHAIACALFGNLRPGDEILAITGKPYDTVATFIGIHGDQNGKGTLKDLGVEYKQIELDENGKINIEEVLDNISDKTKMIYIQRSTGYSWREALNISDIKKVVEKIKEKNPELLVFLDNCYGEFLGTEEPLENGIDLMAGSLIKNPGGGLAPMGGYVAGKRKYVEQAANRLSAPGVGLDTGATMSWTKPTLQGLFIAPIVTASAVKAAILVAETYRQLGYDVFPLPESKRNDIIQAIKLGDPEAVKIFCQAVQEAAPIDSFVVPEPWDMPGYDDPVIMAAGAFIQGSSIELSADAPMREPYNVYFQGGLTYPHGKLGLLLTLQRLKEANIINF